MQVDDVIIAVAAAAMGAAMRSAQRGVVSHSGHREEEDSLAKSTALNTRRRETPTFSAMAAAAFAHTRKEFGERTEQGLNSDQIRIILRASQQG